MQLRWGMVGLGLLAQEGIAPAIKASTSGRLVACASRSQARALEFAAAHGISRAYTSYDDVVQDPQVDAVYVANQNNLHYPVVMAAAAAGKHILCEKPLAMNLAEGEEMVAACRNAGVTLRVGFQHRFSPVLRAAAAVVKEGRIGTLREITIQRYGARNFVRGPWRREIATAGVGALADMGVHAIDFIQWIVGDRYTRVFAVANPPRSSGLPDETISYIMEFAGGCQAIFRVSREMHIASNDLQAFGTRGMLITSALRYVDPHWLRVLTAEGTEESEHPHGNMDQLYLREIEAFAKEVAGERTQMATGEDGVRIVRLTDALIRSLGTGAAVPVDDSWPGE
jgi:1,5-anhydro-D-fructose reductase (1,5-anhydro-D-mannitol-forming)